MFRDFLRRSRYALDDALDRLTFWRGPQGGDEPKVQSSAEPAVPGSFGARARTIGFGLTGLFIFALFYYPIGMMLTHVVDDDPKFDVDPGSLKPNQSHAVALAAALIRREVDVHPWVANDPLFLPGSMLDRMPSFQQGIIGALGRFAFELTDQIGRVRGSSKADGDLQTAAGLLQYAGNVWFFDPKVSIMPTASSESQYRSARKALLDYNTRLGEGTAVFDPRTDNLLATIDRFASDLGSSSAQLDRLIREAGFLSGDATRFYYDSKGRAYAYLLLMRALGEDYQTVIRDRQLQVVWDQALASLAEAAKLKPVIVMNAAPGGFLFPNDLAAQGFYILRARTQLREITSVLQK
jgi:hypothetical protein